MRERLAAIWRRAEAWLRREAYVRAAVAEAAKQAYLDGHAAGATLGHQYGFQVGLAQGELIGRQRLTSELQVEFGIDGGEKTLEPSDMLRIRSRQLH